MKIIVLLTFVFLLNLVAAPASAQDVSLEVSMKGVTIKEVLRTVERQTEYRFFFSDDFTDINKVVSVDIQTNDIQELLSEVFRNSTITYKLLEGNAIVITPVQNQQGIGITGTVTDENGDPIPGVNVLVKGTSAGVITDYSGRYAITVPGKTSVIVFSFIGYVAKEFTVNDQVRIDVVLEEDIRLIEEVVVTAYGITKSKRSLSYSTEQVKMDDINTVKSVNLGDALSGKVAGVSVTGGYGATGIGSSPRIDIRGNRTINSNNQPLIVVDGVVYATDGGGLSSLNSDDIESMNILKGPSAAALYGSAANNGVIVVTTKKGRYEKGRLEFNSLTMFDIPTWYPELQNEYAQGQGGVYNPSVDRYSWGPKMTGQTVTNWTGEEIQLVAQPDNVKDLFRAGLNATNSLSYSGGGKKASYYFSFMNTTAKGLLDTNDLRRNIFNTRISAEVVRNVTIDVKFTYTGSSMKNTPVGGDDIWAPMHMALVMPRSIRTQDIENWTYIDDSFNTRQTTWSPGSSGTYNPYFSMYARRNPSTRNSMHSIASIRWDITDFLFVQARGNMNQASADSELKIMWDAPYTFGGKGDYQTRFSKDRQLVGDVLVGFDKDVVKDINLSINLGAEIKDNTGRAQESSANGLNVENSFFLGNALSPATSDEEYHIQRQSIYGMGQVSYKNMLFLDATVRGEWSSTLPAPHRYFYPSFGLTGIVSDMVKLPDVISYLKVRGSWAEVGNDVGFAEIYQTYYRDAKYPLGSIYMSDIKVATDMIPERTRSLEFGGELKLFENRLGIDLTWYKSNSYNQLISVSTPSASGFSSAQINCGDIQNKGIELMISGNPVRTKDFSYHVYLTFAKNKNLIKELYDNVEELLIETPTLSLGKAYIKTRRPYGELFDYALVRDDAGRLIINENGLPTQSNDPTSYYLGNQNYDWRSSLNNHFTYKNWNLNFLIDLNVGGVRQTATESVMLVSGTSKASLEGREGGMVIPGVVDNGNGTFSENTKSIDAFTWAQFVGGRNGVGELYNYKATNSRLRELSVGYLFDWGENAMVKNLHISLVGRNLFYFYNGCDWFDPDQSSDTGKNGQGAEVSFLPQSRSIGINLKVIF